MNSLLRKIGQWTLLGGSALLIATGGTFALAQEDSGWRPAKTPVSRPVERENSIEIRPLPRTTEGKSDNEVIRTNWQSESRGVSAGPINRSESSYRSEPSRRPESNHRPESTARRAEPVFHTEPMFRNEPHRNESSFHTEPMQRRSEPVYRNEGPVRPAVVHNSMSAGRGPRGEVRRVAAVEPTAGVMPFVEDDPKEVVPPGRRDPGPVLNPRPQIHSPEGDTIYDSGNSGEWIVGGDSGDMIDGGYYGGDDMGMDGMGCGPNGCGTDGMGMGDGGPGVMYDRFGMAYNSSCRNFEGPDVMANERFHVCSALSFLNELAMFSGVHGFKGPMDLGRNGNFGYQLGLNHSDSIYHFWGIGYQLGAQFYSSNYNGDQTLGTISASTRTQTFITGGFFHRAMYGHGMQWGFVADYMNDNYYDSVDLVQFRWEFSYINRCGHEFGFMGAAGTQNSNFATTTTVIGGPAVTTFYTAKPIDQYSFFYRRNLCTGGQARAWAGFTGDRNAIVGSDYRVALTNKWDLIGAYNYIIPSGSNNAGGATESWGLAMNLVWYPGRCRGNAVHNGPYRALFNVADPTNFMVNTVQQ